MEKEIAFCVIQSCIHKDIHLKSQGIPPVLSVPRGVLPTLVLLRGNGRSASPGSLGSGHWGGRFGGMGPGVWESPTEGCTWDAHAAPVASPVLSMATYALPIHKTTKASSLGVHGRQHRGGDNWEGERNVLLFQV